MSLFREFTYDEFIAKFEKEQRELLTSYFDLMDEKDNYTEKSFLLRTDSIYATSCEKLNNYMARIQIGYIITCVDM